jgi:hypothetical protein
MIEDAARRVKGVVPQFPRFTLPGAANVDVLHSRAVDGRLFLCTVEGRTRIEVGATGEFPFDKVANDPRFSFRRSNSLWQLEVRDPRLLETP